MPEAQERIVREWAKYETLESCAQRIHSELKISGKTGEPVSPSTVSLALVSWEIRDAYRYSYEKAVELAKQEEGADNMTPDEMQEAIDRHFINQAVAAADARRPGAEARWVEKWKMDNGKWKRRCLRTFSRFHRPFSLCHLPSALFHFPFSISSLPFGICLFRRSEPPQ